MRLINFPKNPDFSINSHCSPRHSARSKLESQNLIVIPREAKWNRRIYWRTDDGFCNSGQKSPLCRMTGWMADNEFKNPKFCEIDRLPKKSRFSFERSLLTPYSERSKVAKTNCHSARSKVESQNLIVILREAKWNRRIYLRTDDGFCNFGQRCPPCRMT